MPSKKDLIGGCHGHERPPLDFGRFEQAAKRQSLENNINFWLPLIRKHVQRVPWGGRAEKLRELEQLLQTPEQLLRSIFDQIKTNKEKPKPTYSNEKARRQREARKIPFSPA